MSEIKKTIYELDLHESLYINGEDVYVTRVASGWIYKYYRQKYNESGGYDEELLVQIVFVPYDNRFQKNTSEPKPWMR